MRILIWRIFSLILCVKLVLKWNSCCYTSRTSRTRSLWEVITVKRTWFANFAIWIEQYSFWPALCIYDYIFILTASDISQTGPMWKQTRPCTGNARTWPTYCISVRIREFLPLLRMCFSRWHDPSIACPERALARFAIRNEISFELRWRDVSKTMKKHQTRFLSG